MNDNRRLQYGVSEGFLNVDVFLMQPFQEAQVAILKIVALITVVVGRRLRVLRLFALDVNSHYGLAVLLFCSLEFLL